MRHRRRGRRFSRTSSHVNAMLRNMASSLFLTERDAEHDQNKPKVKGRIITTLPKAKEVRSLVEKCITIARRSLQHEEEPERFATHAKRNSDEWREWRQSERWRQWCDARAPVVAARRRALQLLGDKQAVQVLFEEVAPRFADRDGGYTRILKLAKPRLGDAGKRAILELVGVRDRVTVRSERPAFADETKPAPVESTAAAEQTDAAQAVATADQAGTDEAKS